MKSYPLATDASPELAATWLHENGWTLAEVLEAYAGKPCANHRSVFFHSRSCPDCYADGLPQAVLAAYCRRLFADVRIVSPFNPSPVIHDFLTPEQAFLPPEETHVTA